MTKLLHERDPAALAPFASDFGRLVRGAPQELARPENSAQVAALVRRALTDGGSLTPRGHGLSQGGQSVAARGVALDLSALDAVDAPDEAQLTIGCQGGAPWRTVVERCLGKGLLPRVLPLNLDLTVGGVLSVGGIGATSHIEGPVVSTVRSLEVVTGTGETLSVSAAGASGEDDLAGAVLGGLGRCGIITRAELQLRRCAPGIRTFYLLYDSLDAWLDDQQRLRERPRPPEWMEGFTTVANQGLRSGPQGRRPFGIWFYGLHLSYEYGPDGPGAPAAEEALAGLRPYRLAHVEDGETAAFPQRYEPRFRSMRALGSWEEPHPWVEAFLSLEAAREILPGLLDELPLSLGDGHRLMFVAADRIPFSLSVPPGRPLVVFAMLPTGLPAPLRETHLSALRAAHDRLVAAGGKRYLSGWLSMMDATDSSGQGELAWHRHFDDRFEGWVRAKRRFDPQGIFSSVLFPGQEVSTWSSK